MDNLVALAKRRGFVFPSSEIYGGFNGFFDYGPLGAELKKNIRDCWWNDMVRRREDVVGIETSIIMHPKVWEASGHVAGFSDPLVDCKVSKQRYRADQLFWAEVYVQKNPTDERRLIGYVSALESERTEEELVEAADTLKRKLREQGALTMGLIKDFTAAGSLFEKIPSPATGEPTLTPPRSFNMMFQTNVGAMTDASSVAYLRPETAQGMFVDFKNVVDTGRVKLPFGIAQIGKSFRNEITPRNFIFRSREFEMMEVEFFCHPSEANDWYQFWRKTRYEWWQKLGLAGQNLRLRDHEHDELAHYAKDSGGCADVEYAFPFSGEKGFSELEGIAYRSNFDLTQHQKTSGVGLEYFDQERNEKYLPHVIEPAAGLTRGLLAVICEAYTPDESRPSKVFMKFHPSLAPVKAGIFPLVNKDGMPEIAEKLYAELRGRYVLEFDAKQSIGKRYARMDEAGTPFCFTIDGDTTKDQTVTVRHRDTAQQERIALDKVAAFLADKIR